MRNRICFISSTGGHLAQINELLKTIGMTSKTNKETHIVTEKSELAKSVNGDVKLHLLYQQDRNMKLFPVILFLNLFKSIFLFFKIRPKIIISTGAGCVLPFCLLGKLFGSDIVFIESFAKVTTPTLTGKIMYRLANRFYIQWEDLFEYYPRARYRGQIY